MRMVAPNPTPRLALVRLAGRMRRALRLFHRITGQTAVTSLITALPEQGKPFALLPPVHPRCARRLRSVKEAPCSEQWLIHLRSSRRSPRTNTHTCPIGMRCSCVPIRIGDQLMGVAKLVVDSKTSAQALQAAISVLELVVSRTSQDALVSVLSEEVHGLRHCVTELQKVHLEPLADPAYTKAPVASSGAGTAGAWNVALVNRAVEHLQRRYLEPDLSLTALAEALGCNRQYLSHRFMQIAGEHLHTYLITLRVAHACRLLMGTDLLVKEVAHASGFPGQSGLARAFVRYVGVSPVEYRRIFAAP